MFDLVTGTTDRPFHEKAFAPVVLSGVAHVALLGVLLLLPLLYMTEQMPKLPVMKVFAAMPAAAPPPPPPPPPPGGAAAVPKEARALPATENRFAAPIEAPAAITAESGLVPSAPEPVGVAGGVEGGIEGGVAGGIVGGLPEAPPPPPPPAPPQVPIRVGGQIVAPALVYRVEPKYPDFAAQAQIEGLVILEATVDTEGRVQSVQVLRSHGLLDQAAMDAVKQWRYSPLVLNGQPFPFVLTVSVRFSVHR